MPRKSNHVVSNPNGGWSVKKGDAVRASRHFENKHDAVAWGKSISKKERTEFVIHDRNGKIVSRDSYGDDPQPPRERDAHE